MIKQVLVRRYGQGFINVLREEADFRKIREELEGLAGLFFGNDKLRKVLTGGLIQEET